MKYWCNIPICIGWLGRKDSLNHVNEGFNYVQKWGMRMRDDTMRMVQSDCLKLLAEYSDRGTSRMSFSLVI